MEIKELIRDLKKVNPFVEGNIFKSVENVNIDTVVGYKQYGVRHSFLEEYDGTLRSAENEDRVTERKCGFCLKTVRGFLPPICIVIYETMY